MYFAFRVSGEGNHFDQFDDEPRRVTDDNERRALESNNQVLQITAIEPGDPNAVVFIPADLEKSVAEPQVRTALDIARSIQELTKKARRRQSMTRALQVALIPPLAILALGVAVAWVLSGFRERGSRA